MTHELETRTKPWRVPPRNPTPLAMLGALVALTTSVAAPADIGRTSGSWNVAPSGAATYTIPLWVQPGPKGVQPSLAFSYNSQSGNGTMGVGWGLTGFGSIERCASTLGEDGVDAGVTTSVSDRFCINGNKLRITSGPLASYGSAGAVYQTEIADYSRVTSVGTAGTGPQSWIVHSKDGRIYEYGNTVDSRVVYSGSTVYRWLLNKVSDRDGNSYVITYTTNNAVGRVPQSVSWGPTTAGGSIYQYQAYFNYSNKNNPKDIVSVIEQGFNVPTSQRLDSVTIGYSASGSSYATKRQYILSYAASPTTQYSRLTQIKECAATTANCLSPTAITWQDGVSGVNSTPTTALASPGGTALAGKYDFNGDGRSDLAYYDGTRWRVAFSNGNSFSAGVDTGITASTPPQAGRFLSTHQDGFVTGLGGTVTYTAFNGTAFTSTSTGASIPSGAILTDYNGDGLADFIWAGASSGQGGWTGYVYLKLNNSAGAAASPTFDPTTYTALATNLGQFGGNVIMLPTTRCPVERQCDLNGDGRADQMIILVTTLNCTGGPGGCQPVQASYDLLTGYYGYYLANQNVGNSNSYLGFRFNDDKCTDSIYGGSLILRVSSCGSGAFTNVNLPAAPVAIMDWDGDGRSDLLVNSGGTIGVYLSRGSTSSPFSSLITTSIPYNSGCVYFAADIEGDGLDELACVRASSPYSVTYYTHKGGGSVGAGSGTAIFATQVPDLLKSITDGYGFAVSPSYVSLAQSNYTRGTGTALPLVDANDAMYVVGRMTISDGVGGSYDLDYNYKGARRNALLGIRPTSTPSSPSQQTTYKPESDGQWAGFEEISVFDSRNNLKRRAIYEQLFPLVGMLKQSDAYQSNQTSLINHVLNTNVVATLDSTANNTRYLAYLSQSSRDDYEVGGPMDGQLITNTVTTVTYSDTNSGNVGNVTTVITDKDSNSTPSFLNSTWTTSIASSYEPPLTSSSDWCIGFVNQTVVTQSSTASGTPAVTRTTAFAPDGANPGKCRVKTKTIEPGSSKYRLTETYSYDAFGNASGASTVGRQPIGGGAYGDMPARSASIDWGTTGQFQSVVTDASGAVARFTYNADTGTLQKVTDPNSTASNVLETSYQYDGFNRRTRETRPDGTYTVTAYDDCATAGCTSSQHRVTVSTKDFDNGSQQISDEFTYLDIMDRVLVTRARLINSGGWNGAYKWSEVSYDALGHKQREYMPCATASVSTSCRTNYTSFQYDAIGRLTQSTRPRSGADSTPQNSTNTYAGRTFGFTDAANKSSFKVFDVSGAMRQTKDANGYALNFSYDAAGSTIGIVDSQSAVKLSGVTVEYGVGPFVVSSTDSALGASTRTYDSFGELVGWTDAKGTSFTATYDALSRPLTRLEPNSSTSTSWIWGASSSNYNIGQLQSVSSTENGLTYGESFVYDNKLRLQTKTVTIPGDGSYAYDFGYSGSTGQLATLTYPVTVGSRLKLQYAYQNGNLQQVSDFDAGTVFWSADATNPWGQVSNETLGGVISVGRTFDAVTARLNAVQAGIGANPTSLQSYSFLYDKVGNVIQRQNNRIGLTENFIYGSATDNLYRLEHSTVSDAVNTTTNLALTYDASGNILTNTTPGGSAPPGSQSISWTNYNYPSQITANGDVATFSYGPDRQRWKMVFTHAGATETTLYIDGLLEKVTSSAGTNYRHMVFAGNRVVAIQARASTGSAVNRFLLADNLGSVETIADSSGVKFANESFTALGERRDAATWSGPPADRDALDGATRQAFTFQTALGAMGMNHMNGRVQDAVTGRFLSADPFVSQPGYTQNYNRYSYVYNNPATFADPTGFDCQKTESNGTTSTTSSRNNGYQNGSVTAAGEADCMEEIVVHGERDKPPPDPKPPQPEIPRTPDPTPGQPPIDPHQQTGAGGDASDKDKPKTACEAYTADANADAVAAVKNDFDEPVTVKVGDKTVTLNPGEQAVVGVHSGQTTFTSSNSGAGDFTAHVTFQPGYAYTLTVNGTVESVFNGATADIAAAHGLSPPSRSANEFMHVTAQYMFPITVEATGQVIVPVYHGKWQVRANGSGACVKK